MTSVSRTGSTRSEAFVRPTTEAAQAVSAGLTPISSFVSSPAAPVALQSPAIPQPKRLEEPHPIAVDSLEGSKFAREAHQEIGRSFPELPSASDYAAFSVDRDALGMTHVRMNRLHNGLPVFGEQVIVHFGQDGKVRDVTGQASDLATGLGMGPAAVTDKQATEIAMRVYGKQTDETPSAERVIAQDDNGQFRDAYRVSAERLTAGDRPEKMQYLVDAATGEVITSWNQIDGFLGHNDAIGDPMSADGAAAPAAAINDLSSVTSKIAVDQDMDVDSLTLDLDVTHNYQGDLRVTLTSPGGTAYVVHDRTGGSAKDVKGTFDLSAAFKNEPHTKGEWTLTVEDMANGDTGVFNNWGIHLRGKEKDPNPPPPPPPPPPGTADDKSLYAGIVSLGTTQNANGTFSLLDASRGKGVETRDAMNRSSASGSQAINDNNDIWGEASDVRRNDAAVDAQYGGQATYDFYKEMFGRNSIDGNGEKLVSNVHINNNYVNAYWDGRQMHYGDGDGRQASVLTSLDVAGHEITHGLTERTAGLVYRGESGGLNEAMSDILGGFGVEFHAMQKNPQIQADPFLVGEQVWTPGTAGDALRYMDDPTKDRYSIDNFSRYGSSDKEVHRTSGIANNAFTLLVKGGTNRTSGAVVNGGIGGDKALQIFFRALTVYMTPSTTFAQARQACLKAATDLYGAGSPELAKVGEAWSAVGVN